MTENSKTMIIYLVESSAMLIVMLALSYVYINKEIDKHNYSGIIAMCSNYGKFVWEGKTFICKEQK